MVNFVEFCGFEQQLGCDIYSQKVENSAMKNHNKSRKWGFLGNLRRHFSAFFAL